jgi:2-(1,2-epoxy-1,2-dihydrophenyl)acetyl-CoA isomerase
MDFQKIAFRIDGPVATLQLNRPRAFNAIDEDMIGELGEALREASADPQVKAFILTGSGRAFCFGADVSEFQRLREQGGAASLETLLSKAQEAMQVLYDMPKPTLAVLNGFASGLGLDLALACDLRIASERVKLSEAFVGMGLVPDGGGTFLLPRLVGFSRAAELIFTGDPITAREAERIGLINRVVPASELGKAAEDLARKLAGGPPLAVSLAKKAMKRNLRGDFRDALKVEADFQKLCLASPEHREAVRSFLERRTLFGGGR